MSNPPERGENLGDWHLYINKFTSSTAVTETSKNYFLSSYHDSVDMREPPSGATINTGATKVNSGTQLQYLAKQQASTQSARGGFPPPTTLTGGPQIKQGPDPNQGSAGGPTPSVPQLQEMARRQQQQIEAQQQLLVAKEQRLKYLRQQDYRHHQMAAEYERLRRLREKVSAKFLSSIINITILQINTKLILIQLFYV